MVRYSDKYTGYFNGRFLMGPNSICLLDELAARFPVKFTRDQCVLDLGCGKGLTSLFLAKELGTTVYANDLWNKAEDNLRRFAEWGVQKYIIPSCEDANELSFKKDFFDAVFSVDAYHYFAGKEGFFRDKILPLVKKGGVVFIAVPGIRDEFEGRQSELLGAWLGNESHLFHSPGWWKHIIGQGDETEFTDVWEMENFEPAWESWLCVNNEYATGDKAHYDSIIKKYTDFVGIVVKKKD